MSVQELVTKLREVIGEFAASVLGHFFEFIDEITGEK